MAVNWNILAQPQPEPVQFNPLAAIQAHRQGVADFRTDRKDNALIAAGQRMSRNDYTGAASELFGVGDFQHGLAVRGIQQQQDEAARGREAVDALAKTDPRYAEVYRRLPPKDAIAMWQHVQQSDYHKRSLDIQERWREGQLGLRQQREDTRAEALGIQKQKMSFELLQRLGENPTQAQWEAENRPGGLIHAQFQGPVPYDQRGIVLAQLKRRQQLAPDEQDFVDLGFSDDQIKALRRQKMLERSLGRPPSGQQWVPDPSSPMGFRAVQAADPKQTAVERQSGKTAEAAEMSLAEAEKLYQTTRFMGVKMLAGKATSGWIGEDGEKFRILTERAITDINFFLSGKSVSNAERAAFMQMYAPKPTDSPGIIAWKLKGMREFLNTVRGERDQDIPAVLRDFTSRSPQKTPQPAPPAAATPAQDADLRKRYGLE